MYHRLRNFIRVRHFALVIIAWIGLFLFALAISVPQWRPDYRAADAKLEKEKQRIRERGEALSFRELRPSGEHGYAIADNALAILNRLGEIPTECQDSVIMGMGEKLPADGIVSMAEALEKNRVALNALAMLPNAERCRFWYDYQTLCPPYTALPHISKIQLAKDFQRGAFQVAVHSGDVERGVEAILRLCDIDKLLQREPFIICQLIRATIGKEAISELLRLLAIGSLTTDQIQALDQRFARLEVTFRLSGSVLTERASVWTVMENIRQPIVREFLGGTDPENNIADQWSSLGYRKELMQQQAFFLRQMTIAAALIDVPGQKADEQWEQLDRKIMNRVQSLGDDSPLKSLFPALPVSRLSGLNYRRQLTAARYALRVVHYHNENGDFPADLNTVNEPELAEIAQKLWSKTPDYRVQKNGFEITFATRTEHDDEPTQLSVTLK